MGRVIRLMLLCAALGGCATAGGMPSLSGLGGGGSSDTPSKPAAASEPAQQQSSNQGGIWSYFSSPFSSGEQPVSQTPQQPASAGTMAPNPDEALRLVNDYRASKGLPALSLDEKASAAASILAKDMAKHDHMSHFGPNGEDVGKRLSSVGYSYRLAAENVGVGQKSLTEMIEGWKKSPPHSRNMLLAKAKHMGIAYEYKPDTKYKTFWTLVVASP